MYELIPVVIMHSKQLSPKAACFKLANGTVDTTNLLLSPFIESVVPGSNLNLIQQMVVCLVMIGQVVSGEEFVPSLDEIGPVVLVRRRFFSFILQYMFPNFAITYP